jgi:hypothetical protein
MALWSRPDPADTTQGGSDEFEGRSAEEALLRAREALGPSVELRCWKTRRGGVAGFFATEVFVAGMHPPPGAEGPAPRGRRAARARAAEREASSNGSTTGAASGPERRNLDPPTAVTGHPEAGGDAGTDPSDELPESLAALVGDTTDQLTLQFDSIPPNAFHDLLAEAEAAVAAGSEGSASRASGPTPSDAAPVDAAPPSTTPTDSFPTESAASAPVERGPEAPPGDLPVPPASGAKTGRGKGKGKGGPRPADAADAAAAATPDAPPAPAPSDEPATTDGPAAPAPARPPSRSKAKSPSAPATRKPPRPVPDLYDRLRTLGVPEAHMPRVASHTLDALAQAMDRLPAASPLPTAHGTVVVVVGTRRPVERTARLLLGESPFVHGPRKRSGQRVWIPDEPAAPGDTAGAVLQTGDDLLTVQQVNKRRSAGWSSLVTVESDPGLPIRSSTLALIDSLQPDYVLGAVTASMKRSDVEQWRDNLSSIDALALWGVDSTYSPAELLGALPIAFVDGEPSSAMAWTVTLLARAIEERE